MSSSLQPTEEKMTDEKETKGDGYKWKFHAKHGNDYILTRKTFQGATIFRHVSEDEWFDKWSSLSGGRPKKEEKESSMMETESTGDTPIEEKKETKQWTLPSTAPCYRCKNDVKLPLPLFNCECDKKKRELLVPSEGAVPICSLCSKRANPIGINCPDCQYYVAAPNEVFDAGRVNFSLRSVLQSMQEKAILIARDDHEMPCPPQTESDISKDHGINEWVLNKLALKEEQKEKLQKQLWKDQQDRENKLRRKESMQFELKSKKSDDSQKSGGKAKEGRVGVKQLKSHSPALS